MTSKNMYNDYIAGAIGGAAGLIVGHPFDTTKVQLQTQSSKTYNGTYDAIKNISKHGLTRGFFRGLGFPLASYGVINSVFFGVHGHVVHKFTDSKREASYREVAMAGAVGGLVQLGVACPVDVVKVVLQSQIPAGKQKGVGHGQPQYFRGPWQCFRTIIRHGGFRSCYRGLVMMALRDVPGYGNYMLVYVWLNNLMTKHKLTDSSGIIASAISGGLAGSVSWFFAMPFDVFKSKIQADVLMKEQLSMRHYITTTWRTLGLRGFYSGTVVNMVRGFPVNAVTFVVYSQCLKFLQPPEQRQHVLHHEQHLVEQ